MCEVFDVRCSRSIPESLNTAYVKSEKQGLWTNQEGQWSANIQIVQLVGANLQGKLHASVGLATSVPSSVGEPPGKMQLRSEEME